MVPAKKTAPRLTRSKADETEEDREITYKNNVNKILSELLSMEENNNLSDLPIGPGSNNSQILTLNQVQDAIAIDKYESIVDAVIDVRKFFSWIYSTYGIWKNVRTTAALQLEHCFESNLSKLTKFEKNRCNLIATHGKSHSDKKFLEAYKRSCPFHSSKTKNKSNCSDLIIRTHFSKRNELRHVPHLSFYIPEDDSREDLIHWEDNDSYSESIRQEIRFAWQFPYLAHTLYNKDSCESLSISTLERIISCSQYSGDLASLISKLLLPDVKVNAPLSYEGWNSELRLRVLQWFDSHNHLDETQNIEAVLGINENFFAAFDFANPKKTLAEKKFHELTFAQRLWILVALCDTVFKEEYSEGDTIKLECNGEPSSDFCATFIGCDAFNREYILVTPERHDEFRVYRGITKNRSENTYCDKPLGSAYWKSFAEKDTTFEMVANSLETLYNLVDELILKEWLQPTTSGHPNAFQLLKNLHEFVKRVEENPNKYVKFMHRIRVRLYKEYKTKETLLEESEKSESSIFEIASPSEEKVDVKNISDILNDWSFGEKNQLFEIVNEDICSSETSKPLHPTESNKESNSSIQTEKKNYDEPVEVATGDIATSEISDRPTDKTIIEESNSCSIRSEMNNDEAMPRLRKRRSNNLVTSSGDLYVSDEDFSDLEDLMDDSDDDYQTSAQKKKNKRSKYSQTPRPRRMLGSYLAEKRKNIISSSGSDADTSKSTRPKRLRKNKKKAGKLSSEESVHSTTADADIILSNANFGAGASANENSTSRPHSSTFAPSSDNLNLNLSGSPAAESHPLVINICDSPPQTNYSNCDLPSTSASASPSCPSVINICDSPSRTSNSNCDLPSIGASATPSRLSVINICDSPPQTNTATVSDLPVINITDSPPRTSDSICDLPSTSTPAMESSPLVINIVDSPPQTNNSDTDKNHAKSNPEVIELDSDDDIVEVTSRQAEIAAALTPNTPTNNCDGSAHSTMTQPNSSTAIGSDPSTTTQQPVSSLSPASARPCVTTTQHVRSPVPVSISPSSAATQPLQSPIQPAFAPLNVPRQRLLSPSTPPIGSSTSPRLVRPRHNTPSSRPRSATPLSRPRSATPLGRLRSITPQSARFVTTPTNQTPRHGYNSSAPSNLLKTGNYTHPLAGRKSYQQSNRISITPSVTMEPVSTVYNFERSGQSVSIIPQSSPRPTVQRRLFKNEVEAYIIPIEGTTKYQLKLANGTCHPLSNEQVLALRRDNKGVLPKKIKIPVDPEVADKIEPTFVIDD